MVLLIVARELVVHINTRNATSTNNLLARQGVQPKLLGTQV